MSDDTAHSSSSSESEADDMEKNGLVATREKRSNAGSLYAILRNTLDDTQLQEGLMDDEDDDVGDYQESDRDDDDAAMESSSEEDDAGPPKEGEEDLEGEKALQKSERAEARKKRKVKDARLKLPAWAATKKRVKLAADVKTEDGAPKPKKKSERANWLPSPADAPTRQSSRSLAMASRETTHAHLKQSFQRSEKQRKVMKDAAHREKATKRADLTLEQRMEKAARIARETKREFGKWEREELERQRIRDELLAAKRSRGLEGPFIRYWSGSGIWNGQKFVVTRNLPQKERDMLSMASKKATETVEERKLPQEKNEDHAANIDSEKPVMSLAEEAPTIPNLDEKASTPATTGLWGDTATVQTSAPLKTSPEPADQSAQWLSGIHDYAALTTDEPSQPAPTVPVGTASTNETTLDNPSTETPQAAPLTPSAIGSSQALLPPTYHGWPPGAQQLPEPIPPPPPPPPPAPVIREQALRACIMLEQFDELNTTKKAKTSSALEPTQAAKLLLPASHTATFSPDEAKYLTGKHRKAKTGDNIPPPPPKPRCAITAWPAKYRDPKTGLAYFDMQMYKAVQRILAGGSMWSGLLGAWVGPAPGGISIGRPASGVPEGFTGPPPAVKVEGGNV